jgi:hypothetical protein
MVYNQMDNSTLKQDLVDESRLNVAYDTIPSTVIPSIQPVITVEKKYCDISKIITLNNGTAGIIYTTPTQADFYLCSASISIIKDAGATSTLSYISAVLNSGIAASILPISSLTTTAQTANNTITFSPPLKIARGTNITLNHATANANISGSAAITGYTSQTLSA